MKIVNIREEVDGDIARISADVKWEDCSREDYTMNIEAAGEIGRYLTPSPHTFFIGGVIPALHYGEKRLWIEGNLCSELIYGIEKIMQIFNYWYRTPQSPLVDIEPRSRVCLKKQIPPRSAFFFSGGIDAYAILRENRQHYPEEHPLYFRDGILAFGLELDDRKRFNHVVQVLQPAAGEANINLVAVSTNLYLIYRAEDEANRFRFWIDEYNGAALAAIAHAFSNLYTDVSIAGNCGPDLLQPWGSHPVIDPCFSSANLTIRHEGISTSRLAKTRLVAGWEPALTHLRVCNRYRTYSPGKLNCGKCEKCIRTMLELLAVGALEKTNAFPRKTVSAEEVIHKAKITNPFTEHFYTELLEPLKAMGRNDLVNAICDNLKAFRKKMSKRNKGRPERKFNQIWKKIMYTDACRK